MSQYIAVILMWVFPIDTPPAPGFSTLPEENRISIFSAIDNGITSDPVPRWWGLYTIPGEAREYPLDPFDLEARMGVPVEHPIMGVRTAYRIETNFNLWALGERYEIGPVHPWGADLNKDGGVTGADFNAFGGCFYTSPLPDTSECRLADYNEDGGVTGLDFNVFGQFYNEAMSE